MGTVIREMARARLLQAIACAVLALAVLHPVTRADQAAMLQDAEADLVVQLDVVGAPAGNALVLKTTATLKSLTAKLAKVTVVSRDKSQKTDAKVKAAQVALEQAQFNVRKVGATQKAAKATLTKEKDAIKEVKTIKVDVAKEKGYQGKVTKA